MINIALIITFILITVYCIARIWEYRYEEYEYLYSLVMWLVSVVCIASIYFTMKDGKKKYFL